MKKFFQVVGIVFFIFFILVIIVIMGGIVFLKNFDIKKYKPQMTQAASKALGRTVDFRDIDLALSLHKGIRLHLTDFSIAENPDFGTGNFLTVKDAEAGIDILSYVMSRKISVPSLVIRSPQVTVIRKADGALNIQTLGAKFGGASSVANPPAITALPAIFINSLKVDEAEIVFIDKGVSPEIKLTVTHLNIAVQRFSLGNPFDVLVEAAFLTPQKNFHWEGKAQLDLTRNEVRLLDVGVALKLNDWPSDKLKVLPMMAGVVWPRILEGEVNAKIKEAQVSDKGIGKFIADVSFHNGKVQADDMAPGISLEVQKIDVDVENFSLDKAALSKIRVKAAVYQDETNIDFASHVAVDLAKMEFRLTDGEFATDLALWPLKKMKAALAPLKDLPLPENLSGKFHISLKQAVVTLAGLQSVLLDMKWRDGTISLKDLVPGTAITLNKTEVTIGNFSFGKQFSVSLKAAYLSEMQNISFDGAVTVDPKTQTLSIANGLAGINLNSFSLDRFKASGLVPVNVLLPQTLAGVFQTHINDLRVSPQGIGDMKVDVKWQNGKIVFNDVSPGISIAANQVNVAVTDFTLGKPLKINATLGYESDEPNVSFNGEVMLDPATQKVSLKDTTVKLVLAKIPLELIKTKVAPLKDVMLPALLSGQLDFNIKTLAAGPQGLETVLMDILFKDGQIGLKDVVPGVSLAARHMDFDIKDFALGSPFKFVLSLAYLSEEANIQTQGTATLIPADQTVLLKDTTFKADLGKFSMEQLKANVASLASVPLPVSMKGELNVVMDNATFGTGGLTALTSNVLLKDWEIKMKELPVPLSGLETKFKITESQMTGDDLVFNLGKGQITAQVNVHDYMKTQDFDMAVAVKGMDLTEVLVQSESEVKVEGLLSANIKAKGQGANMNSIDGEGNFDVKEAKLKNLNVFKTILEKISVIPNLTSRIEANIPEQYKAKLESQDTQINNVSGTFGVTSGQIVFDPLVVEADEFILSGKSQAAFDQTYSVDGAFKITAELSKIMGDSAEELKYLYDSESHISLPVHITGQGSQKPSINVIQSALDLIKNAVRQQGKKELGKILDKALGIPQSSQPPAEEGDTPSQSQESPGSQIIGGILNKILK